MSLAEVTEHGNNTFMGFGKHAELTYIQVYRRHRDYLQWARSLGSPNGGLYDFLEWARAYEHVAGVQRGGYYEDDLFDDYDGYYSYAYSDGACVCEKCNEVCEGDLNEFGHCEYCEITCDGCGCAVEYEEDLCAQCDYEEEEEEEEDQEQDDDDGEVEFVGEVTREEKDAKLRAAAVDVESEPSRTTEESKFKTEGSEKASASRRKRTVAETPESAKSTSKSKTAVEADENADAVKQSKRSKVEQELEQEVKVEVKAKKAASPRTSKRPTKTKPSTPKKGRAPKDEENADMQEGAFQQSIADQRGQSSGAGSSGTNPPERQAIADGKRRSTRGKSRAP